MELGRAQESSREGASPAVAELGHGRSGERTGMERRLEGHYRHFGTVFEPKTSILGTLGAHVGTRGVHCGDPGLPKRPRRRPLGVRCCFLSVFGGCWVPLGDQFGVILGTFSGFWVAKWEVWWLTPFSDAFWVKNDLSAFGSMW